MGNPRRGVWEMCKSFELKSYSSSLRRSGELDEEEMMLIDLNAHQEAVDPVVKRRSVMDLLEDLAGSDDEYEQHEIGYAYPPTRNVKWYKLGSHKHYLVGRPRPA